MWQLQYDDKLGGACGEIEVKRTISETNISCCDRLSRSLILFTQFAEYKIGHALDKSIESLFGYVSVLPGAFSAFRWEAIKDGPLDKFLRGLLADLTCHELNLYLAEDRVMCFEIVAGGPYRLKYLP